MNHFRSFNLLSLVAGASLCLSSSSPLSAATPVVACFDHFQGLPTGSTSQCVDYNFRGDTPGGPVFLGAGMAGPMDVSFDLFTDEPNPLPDNFDPSEPVRGSVTYTNAGGVLTVTHRDRFSFFPNFVDPGVVSPFLGGAIGSQSKVTFIATTTDDSTMVPIKIEIDQTFTLIDPLDNDTSGSVDTFFLVNLTDVDGPQIINKIGSSVFDSDGPDTVGGDYVGNFTGSNPNPSQLDGTLDLEMDASINVNDPLTVESLESLGIFSDGFESGDVSAWSGTSENTFIVTITSPNPNVTFTVIPEPSTLTLIVPGLFLLGVRRRRS